MVIVWVQGKEVGVEAGAEGCRSTAMKNLNPYIGYFPYRLFHEVSTLAELKCLCLIFGKSKQMQRVANIPITQEDRELVRLSRWGFYRAVSKLEEKELIVVNRTRPHILLVTISPSILDDQDISNLTTTGKSILRCKVPK